MQRPVRKKGQEMAVFLRVSVVLTCSLLLISSASAQVTRADYERATGLSDKYEYLTVNVPDPATWIANTGRFYYRKSVKGGHEFVLMDAETRQRSPAFDHQRLAEALGERNRGEVHGGQAAVLRVHVCRRRTEDRVQRRARALAMRSLELFVQAGRTTRRLCRPPRSGRTGARQRGGRGRSTEAIA